MALKASARRRIPAGSFVYPPGSKVGGKRGAYPINTLKRARAALSYSAQKRTKGSYATVAKAVHRRYPSIKLRTRKR